MRLDTPDVLDTIITSYLRDNVYTSLPAKVKGVSSFGNKQFVDVVIDVARKRTTGSVDSGAGLTFYDVPIVMPSAGGGMLSFPVAVGDTVLLVFSMRSIELWKRGDASEESIPTDSRHYNKNDAIAISGLYTSSTNLRPSTTDVELKFKNSSIKITPEDLIRLDNSTASVEMNQDGTVTVDNGSVSVTLNPDGSHSIDNGSGSIVLGSNGVVNINGVTISTSGAISTPSSVTASGSISGAGVTDTNTNNTLSTHKHPANNQPPTPST